MKILLSWLCILFSSVLTAQPVSGVWQGKITNGKGMFAYSCKVELKLVKKGDSLYGTVYYFANPKTYIRYAVKGYFNAADNAVHWWDDKLLDHQPVGKTKAGIYTEAMISNADFNCPGNKIMTLEGKSQIGTEGPEFALHFDKTEKPLFKDEWDPVIEGYFTGMADPGIIDSVYAIANARKPPVSEETIAKLEETPDSKTAETIQDKPGSPELVKSNSDVKPEPAPVVLAKNDPPKQMPAPEVKKEPAPEKAIVKAPAPRRESQPAVQQPKPTAEAPVTAPPPTTAATLPKKEDAPVTAVNTPPVIDPVKTTTTSDPVAVQMFETRKKINQAEIPVLGDSVELNFYDNAEVDGDSISLFLNGKLLFNHVLLTAQAYSFKIPTADLPDGSELTMVAENLGTIPPNTAFMMAIVNGERYTARIESTEQTSGVIKLVRR